MLYQIQTKYRDEARPRAGLIRVREFTMKDAYSFHASLDCLTEYYNKVHEAYVRIFRRLGLTHCVSIESDTGMMGGAASHEFMAIADCGEDTVFSCPQCDYRANKEVAKTGLQFKKSAETPLEKVHTPALKTIEEVSSFLKIVASQTGKAIFYSDDSGKLYLVVIRGDLEVNETKLRNAVKVRELRFATDEEIRSLGSVPGFASPLGLAASKVEIVFDRSASETSNLVVGANEIDYHYLGFNFDRDLPASSKAQVRVLDLAAARAGDPCPMCGGEIQAERGIEVGNIFQLGTKYSQSMNCTYLDHQGKAKTPIMGCYGIGVGRSMAAVIEQSHDKYGPIWPGEIAPYQAQICALNLNEAQVKSVAEGLYEELLSRGIEVLYDDRNEKAGIVFNDADLMGAPLRVIVSQKTVAMNSVELKNRRGTLVEMIAVSQVVSRIVEILRKPT